MSNIHPVPEATFLRVTSVKIGLPLVDIFIVNVEIKLPSLSNVCHTCGVTTSMSFICGLHSLLDETLFYIKNKMLCVNSKQSKPTKTLDTPNKLSLK